jgi:DNA-binding transcriptional ArsR family regulator
LRREGERVAKQTLRRQLTKEDVTSLECRLARALSHKLRINILESLGFGPASAVDLVPILGATLGRISYHMNVLAKLDLIEPIDRVPVRGTYKTVYRSLVEMFLDEEMWTNISPATKAIFSEAGIRSIADRAERAIQAKTFDSRQDRHMTVVTLQLDEEAWQEAARLTLANFEAFHRLADESSARMGERDTRFPATLGQLLFESPARTPRPTTVEHVEKQTLRKELTHDEVVDLEYRLARALSHKVRINIVELLGFGPASAVELEPVLGVELSKISYHMKVLLKLEMIEPTETISIRGAQKTVYKSLVEMFLDEAMWAKLSPVTQAVFSGAGIVSITDRAERAMQAKTFDSRQDRHMTGVTLRLDEEAWTEAAKLTLEDFEAFHQLADESSARVGERDTRFPATLGQLLFESPPARNRDTFSD